GSVQAQTEFLDHVEKEYDESIIAKASTAANGHKFQALFAGNWNGCYRSQSEADFALINIIAFYTQNRAQIARLFRKSALAQTPKDNYKHRGDRHGYVASMVEKALSQQVSVPPCVREFTSKFQAEMQVALQAQSRSVAVTARQGSPTIETAAAL